MFSDLMGDALRLATISGWNPARLRWDKVTIELIERPLTVRGGLWMVLTVPYVILRDRLHQRRISRGAEKYLRLPKRQR
jgi:hypothetical protein